MTVKDLFDNLMKIWTLSQKNALNTKKFRNPKPFPSKNNRINKTNQKKKKDITTVSNQEYPILPIHICGIFLSNDIVIILSDYIK